MNMISTEYRPSLSTACLSASLSAQYRAKVYGSTLALFPAKSQFEPVDPHLLRTMRGASQKRSARLEKNRLAALAAAWLTDEGRQKQIQELAQRKKLIAKRRLRLARLIPTLEN